MIEIEKAIRDFEKYANKYDTENDNILRKIKHTYRVVDIAEEIAKNLNLENEELNLVKLIALFHDIGRFEQYTKYKTYNDLKSFDHGDYGVEVLTKKLVIDKYVDSEIEKNIVLKAVKNHNKYEIEKGLSKKELFFSNIIRDADKLDIIYEAKTIFFKSKEEMEEINNGTLSQEIMKYFYMKKNSKKAKTL